jgi:hypothetical protein
MTTAGSQASKREDARAELLAFDPYSPIFPACAPEQNDPDPLALDPYSPCVPTPAPEPSRLSDSNR